MKKIILSLLFTALCFNGFSKTWTIVSSGMTFSPATLTINQGDSVKFTMDASHNAVEVSQTVWNANGTTANNGFSIPFAGGTALPNKLAVGTHYYVCTPHAAFGMKGRIIVQAATTVAEVTNHNSFEVFSNPSAKQLNVQWNFAEATVVELSLFDSQGKLIETLMPRRQVTGSNIQAFNLSRSMAPGIYLLRLNAGATASIRKVVVL